jgi:hypothetical protein
MKKGINMTKLQAGTWVKLRSHPQTRTRAPSLPEDTRKVPYLLRVSGFWWRMPNWASVVRIRTIIGRELQGILLKTVNPVTATALARWCGAADNWQRRRKE